MAGDVRLEGGRLEGVTVGFTFGFLSFNINCSNNLGRSTTYLEMNFVISRNHLGGAGLSNRLT
jgi:hypothetical protein